MPKHVMSREDALSKVIQVFRTFGYEGASLSRMHEATGLKSSSLYNYFPKGKQDMAEAALADVADLLEKTALAPLRGPGTPAERLAAFAETVSAFYENGKASCLLDVLSIGEAGTLFSRDLSHSARALLHALSRLAEDAGASPAEAAARAEDAVIAIEGALVLSRALGSTAPFKRTIDRLPGLLIAQT